MKLDWYEYNHTVIVKVDTTEHSFCVPEVRVVGVPFVRGESVVTLIDGSRKSRFTSLKWHFDIELSWKEIGQTNYATYHQALQAIYDGAQAQTIKFFPHTPFVDAQSITVAPNVDNDASQFIFTNSGIRSRPMKIKLISTTPVLSANLPTWIDEQL
jgi:hypothetical protein